MDESQKKFIGMVLDNKYKISSLIGTGGSGNVFVGEQPTYGDPIAIKILHSSLTTQRNRGQTFLREAQLALSIKHPMLYL